MTEALNLPCNLEAEQGLLSALLSKNSLADTVAEVLKPEHFADDLHARLYEAIISRVNAGKPANAVTLKGSFAGEVIEGGGNIADYIAQLQSAAALTSNARYYAEHIRDLFVRRELALTCQEMAARACEAVIDEPGASLIEEIEAHLHDLAENQETNRGIAHLSDFLSQAIDGAKSAVERGNAVTGIAHGFTELDELTGGLHPGELTVVAARPGMGKTGFAVGLAENAARSGFPTVFFSLEMPGNQTAGRILAAHSGISLSRLRRGRVSTEELATLQGSVTGDLSALPIFIDETGSITLSAIRTQARRLKRKQGLGLIIVDYLQLIGIPRGERRNRVDDVSAISAGLKALAKELGVPVVALSQLSRQVEQRDDKRPLLSDLRDSGSIEQDADVVIYIFRQAYYEERREPIRKTGEKLEAFNHKYAAWRADLEAIEGKAQLIVAKQRNGPLGDVELRFDGRLTKFSDPDKASKEKAA